MTLIKLCSFTIILLQIHLTFQLSPTQQRFKDILESAASILSPELKITTADMLKSILSHLPLPQYTTNMLTEIVDEFKLHPEADSMKKSEATTWANIVANELKRNKTFDDLNELMSIIGEKQPSSEYSASRYLAIHLKNNANDIATQLTFYSEDLIKSITDEYVNVINKHTNAFQKAVDTRSV